MKKLKRLIMIFLVIIIILIICMVLLKLNSNTSISDIGNENDHSHVDEYEEKDYIHLIEDANTFYTVENCINLYLDYLVKDSELVKEIENKYYKSKNILELKQEKESVAQKMWGIDNESNSKYYVYTKIRDKNLKDITSEEDYYFIVVLDKNNATFSIALCGSEYLESDLNYIKNDPNEIIQKNNVNGYTDITIYNEDIVEKYFYEYIKYMIYKKDVAYKLLDSEYIEKKFSNFNLFEEYIDNNIDKIKNAVMVKYSVDNFEDYTKYTIIDNYNNCYIIKEKSVMNYTILLDNYTLESEEFVKKYNESNDDTKVVTNVDKIFKLLNNKEYEEIYNNYLNITYRERYFKNIIDFENYIENHFFDYNYIDNSTLKKEGNYYIVDIHFKSGYSLSSEENDIEIIMLLGDNTKFQISFNMN